ncbi:MAG: four-carbon acid sugar kinase family protein, partial [Cyclobacteriaceae bacterium]
FVNEFKIKTPLFFVLANTRSLPETKATERAREIGENLLKASEKTGRPFLVISRSDSTLRGYFPSEVAALSRAAGLGKRATLLIPAFFEGGRITEDNTHYIVENGKKIPVAETFFARDKSFGYVNSDLTKWIEEKSKGGIKPKNIKSLSLNDIHAGEVIIFEKLKSLKHNDVMVINCTTYVELESICLVLHRLIKEGKAYNFRTAASFVSAFSGMDAHLWKPSPNTENSGPGGLIIVGSYVKKSTAQLKYLLGKKGIKPIEVSVERIIKGKEVKATHLSDVVDQIENCLITGIHSVVYTSRNLVAGSNPEESLAIGEKITRFLVQVVASIETPPAFIIAKGGITSNDIAVKGLGMKRAFVLGQVIPGVPVWRLGEETRFPEVPYVVYPGNVGDEQSLSQVFKLFTDKPS